MKVWTDEQKIASSLAVVFILLGIANLTSANMIFSFSHSRSIAMLKLTLFLSFAALIVVRRTTKVLAKAKEAGESNVNRLRFQVSLNNAIHEVSLDGILVVDRNRIVTSYNQRFLDIWQILAPSSLNDLTDDRVGTPDGSLL